jgi:putative nucleotidyltransferase with HDIG domain
MEQEKILVVDDSPETRDFLFDVLDTAGYKVERASDGEEALDIAEQIDFDLVITDINMPRCDGFQLLNRLNTSATDVNVIIITGQGSLDSARNAMVGGAADFINKPFRHDEILSSVERTLENSRVSRESNRLKDTCALFDVSEAIAFTPGVESTSRKIIDAILTQTNSSCGAMVEIIDSQWATKEVVDLKNRVAAGPVDWARFPIAERLSIYQMPILVSREKEKFFSPGLATMKYQEDLFPELFPFENATLFFPLLSNNQLFGFFMINKRENEPAFTPSDLQLMSIIANQTAVSEYNHQLVRTLEQNYLNTLLSLTLILEAKHSYTLGHSQRVTNLALMIGRKIGLASSELETLKYGTMLHDIGKIAISDGILDKPGPLNKKEIEIVRQHPVIGDEITRPITFIGDARQIIRHHHEWFNGKGSPDGLAGDELSPLVTICSVADSVDAMASVRSYRKPLTPSKIRRELLNGAGTQFNPDIVEIALEFVRAHVLKNLDQPVN